jgi:hypothetical protein
MTGLREDLEECGDLRIDGVIEKPFEFEPFCAAVADVFQFTASSMPSMKAELIGS